jgi:hypothetical protein
MGYLRMLLLGNLGQQMDIEEQREQIDELRQRMKRNLHGEVNDALIQSLASENKELALYIATIFRVLVAKNIISPSELTGLIDAVDKEDGRQDGRYEGDVKASPNG